MRCALYARVSLEEQVERYGLASQIRALREHAAKLGYSVVIEAVEEGHGGATLDRPELDRVRSLVRERGVDVVLAHAPDRLSRDVAHVSILWDEAKRRGARLEFVTCQYEQTPEGKLMLQLISGFSEMERLKIAERTLRGRREKAKQGRIVGGRITYGYVLKDGKYEIDPERADVVRQIFRWCLSDTSIRSIVKRLTESGIKPWSGEKWATSSVRRILTNETYTGTAHYNRRHRGEKKTQMRATSEWIEVPVPQIIPRSDYEKVQHRLQSHINTLSGRPGRIYLLRGLMRCAECQKSFGGSPCRGVRYYRCGGRDSTRKQHCCAAQLNADRTEAAIWKALSDAYRSPERLRAIIEANRAQLLGCDTEQEIARLRTQADSLRRREASILRALVDPDLSEHYREYKAQLNDVRSRRSAVDRELSELCAEMPSDLGSLCAAAAAAIDLLTDQDKQDFLRAVVESITVRGRTAEMVCGIPGSVGNRTNRPHDRYSFQRGMSFKLKVDLAA